MEGGLRVRKVWITQAANLLPIIMLLCLSANIYIFLNAHARLLIDEYTPDIEISTVVPEDTVETEEHLETVTAVASTISTEFGYDASSLVATSAKSSNGSGTKKDQKPYGTYQVVKGDSLYWIAERFDTTVDELMELNQLTDTLIRAGQVLTVPTHTLKEYPCGLKLTDKEVQWIAQMIHAEARGEPYLGQVAVGAVIINRLKSSSFPDTVYGVLFQKNAFQPIANGSFFRPASEQAYRAALEALNGHDPTNGALYFYNPKLSNDRVMQKRTPAITIGQHKFLY